MARVKLTEFDAKRLLFPQQAILSANSSSTSSAITKKFGDIPLVVKVDQGIKKRGLQGLVKSQVDAKGAVAAIRRWETWQNFLIEPFVAHEKNAEKFLSIERKRSGWLVLTSDKGGIDIESNWDSVKTESSEKYQWLIDKLETYHLPRLELNPYLDIGGEMLALDAAAEIDDAALSLPQLSSLAIEPVGDLNQSRGELAIAKLDATTPASLKYRLLNQRGRLWMLLSGGGASLVLADEVADLGYGQDLANYGEYSGAPSEDDTYLYTKAILQEMLNAKTTGPRSLVIAGGVANFTDVAKTFRGLIRALNEYESKLQRAKIKIFVRRGGPNEEKGLQAMRDFLRAHSLLGKVSGKEVPLTSIIKSAVEYFA